MEPILDYGGAWGGHRRQRYSKEGREPLLPGTVGPEGRERLANRPRVSMGRVPSLHYFWPLIAKFKLR
eukprot:COSAG05_NODE_1937_length_3810_cov_2.941287_2_plen_68_part_00